MLSTGGTDGFTNLLSMELFSPPYLFAGTRPNVTNATADAAYGATLELFTTDACVVAYVVLMRPAAQTHHTDAGMRRIRLTITGRLADRVQARVPTCANVAPAGYYQAFAVSVGGVPSVGRFIRIHP